MSCEPSMVRGAIVDGVVSRRWKVSSRGKLNLGDVMVSRSPSSSDCIPVKNLVGVRGLCCNIALSEYQALFNKAYLPVKSPPLLVALFLLLHFWLVSQDFWIRSC